PHRRDPRPGAVIQAPPPPVAIVAPGVSGAGCFIQTDFQAGGKHNFELVALEGAKLLHYWRANDHGQSPWRKGEVISSRAIAPGCLAQSDFMSGGHGNLEAVVPEQGGDLVHYWHDSGKPAAPWVRSGVVTHGVTGGACLITSDFVTNGHRNLEVMVQKGDQLWHHWHTAGAPPDNWPGELVTTGVTALGPGCLIQSDYQAGGHRNLEVVVQKGSELWHHWHWQGMAPGAWPGKAVVSGITAPGCLIASDFAAGNIHNFEVLVQKGGQLWHHWRWDGMTGDAWPGAPAVNDVAGAGCFLQGDFRTAEHANFELVVPATVAGEAGPIKELVHHFKINQGEAQPWQRAQTVTFHGRSEKVCMLTGDTDWETGVPTTTRTQSRFGMGATDLGYPVEHQGRLALLFGDTWDEHHGHPGAGKGERAQGEIEPADDAVGWISSRTPPTLSQCPDLEVNHVAAGPTKRIVPATVSGPLTVKHGYFNVPSGGVSDGGWLYAFFWTNHCQHDTWLAPNPVPLARPAPQSMTPENQAGYTLSDLCPESDDRNSVGRGVLARSSDGGRTFADAVPMPLGFVYATAIDANAITGLPAEQRLGTYVFAVPRYRGSVPYLAYAPPGALHDPPSWKFLVGLRADGTPSWTSEEVWKRGSQQPWVPPGQPELFAGDRCLGEFSVTWNGALKMWLMLYNCYPRGIVARVAHAPWGPWSDGTVILNEKQDGAPCRLVMTPEGCGNQERYHGGNKIQKGGLYAPFVMERYTTSVGSFFGGQRQADVYWLLSTWAPYQVVVMRTRLRVWATRIPHVDH
ncbi:MAG TPA: DUF4185 domain-containing protein, partial [Vicinamibacteria bacterium]